MNKNTQTSEYSGFNFIIKWSLVFFIILIIIGVLYRFLFPLELQLDENEYSQRVFTQVEADVYFERGEEAVWTLEDGEILYVIDEDSLYFKIRPMVRTPIDSVWIRKEHTLPYTSENYSEWQYQ